MIQLGISAFYFNSSVCLMKNGKVISFYKEEEFTNIKNDSSFPLQSIQKCLQDSKLTISDIDYICFYENPQIKKNRVLKVFNRYFFSTLKLRFKFLKNYYFNSPKKHLKKLGYNKKITYIDHHTSHAATSYFLSPYKSSSVLTIDGVGEWETITISHGKGTSLNKLYSINFPNSLGMLYSTITAYLGFKPNQEEGKIMELSQKGNSNKYYNKLNKIFIDDLKIHQKYFTWEYSEKIMFNINLCNLLNLPPRLPEEFIKQDHKDLAAALQKIYEEKFLYLLNLSQKLTNENNICLGGGCAYNYLANKKIKNIFKNSFIPPNPSDSGSPIGACLYNYYKLSYEKNNIKN